MTPAAMTPSGGGASFEREGVRIILTYPPPEDPELSNHLHWAVLFAKAKGIKTVWIEKVPEDEGSSTSEQRQPNDKSG